MGSRSLLYITQRNNVAMSPALHEGLLLRDIVAQCVVVVVVVRLFAEPKGYKIIHRCTAVHREQCFKQVKRVISMFYLYLSFSLNMIYYMIQLISKFLV